MFCTYILYSKDYDRYYVGSTEDIEARLKRHNSKMVPSTRKYSPWILVYTEFYDTRAAAFSREQAIKSMKSRQYIERLVNKSKDT
jgi:putative endonuclease